MDERVKEENKELSIPAFVPDREEVISGYGKKEIAVIMAVLAVSIVVAIIICSGGQDKLLIGVGVAVFSVLISVMAVKRDRAGENLIDMLKVFNRYQKNQKKFMYEYTDPFLDEEVMNENTDKNGE